MLISLLGAAWIVARRLAKTELDQQLGRRASLLETLVAYIDEAVLLATGLSGPMASQVDKHARVRLARLLSIHIPSLSTHAGGATELQQALSLRLEGIRLAKSNLSNSEQRYPRETAIFLLTRLNNLRVEVQNRLIDIRAMLGVAWSDGHPERLKYQPEE